MSAFASAPGRGGAGRERNEVRTIFEDVEEDIDIPIYDIPLPQEVRTP